MDALKVNLTLNYHAYVQYMLINSIYLDRLQDPKITLWVNTANLQTFEIRVFTELTDSLGTSHPYVYGGGGGGVGDYFWKQISAAAQNGITGWMKIEIPIGVKAGGWNTTNHATWSKPVRAIVLKFVCGLSPGWAEFDSININAQTVRVAKSSKAIDVQGGIRTKLINEIVVKLGRKPAEEVKEEKPAEVAKEEKPKRARKPRKPKEEEKPAPEKATG